jgi:Uma2 family endonuclease
MAITVATPAEHRMIINVSWRTYESLLADLKTSSAPRLSFDQGTLEIMSPSSTHEELNRTVAAMVEVWAEELGIEFRNLGSTTFKREDLQKGFESDSCFYIQNLPAIRGKRDLDLSVDPPPDLVIEIDITSGSMDKLPLFSRLGISEVWRYDGDTLRIYRLEQGALVEREESQALPRLTRSVATRFLKASEAQTRLEWLRSLRTWLRQGV